VGAGNDPTAHPAIHPYAGAASAQIGQCLGAHNYAAHLMNRHEVVVRYYYPPMEAVNY